MPTSNEQVAKHWPELLDKVETLTKKGLFTAAFSPEGFDALAHAFTERRWSRASQALVISALLDEIPTRNDLRTESVEQWIRYHDVNDSEAVIDCLQLLPPTEVTVIGRLPKTGSQKIVFRASWKLQQKTVILKKLIGAAAAILSRELRSHPLSADHPNIIKTYTASNARNEQFLIEEHLDNVLHDEWRATGAEQTALLIHDITAALKYISDQGLVHGDIKPDNIGYHRGRFILLDFGICRPANEFTDETSATGSLRTRGPELLLREQPQSISSDVWALGATVACVFCGEFPLVYPGEKVPRVSTPTERKQFEEKLEERVKSDYSKRIGLILRKCKDSRIQSLLERMLHRDAGERLLPANVIETIRSTIGYAIPEITTDSPAALSPSREIELLAAQWPDQDSVSRLPPLRLQKLDQHLQRLSTKLASAPPRYREFAEALQLRIQNAPR